MNFGWLKNENSYETSSIKISAIALYKEAIAEVEASENQDGNWFYPPIIYKSNSSGPRVPASRYELPVTHCISIKNQPQNRELLEFMVVYYGWLNGQRLNPEGWGHLAKTSISPGTLTDFVLWELDISRLLSKGEDFWHSHQKDNLSNLMLNALHWYMFAFSYERDFERFMAQYTVLDTLYNITLTMNGCSSGHAGRVELLSAKLGLECPSWGVMVGKKTEISEIRNNLIHEAKLAGKPIGFAYENNNILLNLEAFNCRAIAALFGAKGRYSRSSCETRQKFGFDID